MRNNKIYDFETTQVVAVKVSRQQIEFTIKIYTNQLIELQGPFASSHAELFEKLSLNKI